MKLELVLNDDVELRAYIKELIKNEVINISREEIKEVTSKELNRKLDNTFNTRSLDKLIEDAISKQVGYILRQYFSSEESLNNYFNSKIEQLIIKQLTLVCASITTNIIKELRND